MIEIIDLRSLTHEKEVGWICGLGKARFQDPILELAFYNRVSGDARNPVHYHKLSTERLLVIEGGIIVMVQDKKHTVRPFQMISIPPELEHQIVEYLPDTVAFNIRNSPKGAVGHLPEDRT